MSNLSPVPRVHLVFDLCEEPHPRIDVPAGTVCDYDMEQGLLCKYPEGTAPIVMPPAHWLDAETAAVENQFANNPAAALVEQDNGTGYFASDDALGASAQATSAAGFVASVKSAGNAPMPVEEQLNVAPAPGSELKGAIGAPQQATRSLHLPGGAAEADAAAVFGTVGNGQASTWVTAAMHPQSTMQFA